MGRKRLLTLLAGLVAAVGLQAAPAMAQSLDLPGASVDLEEGIDVELDVELGDDVVLDPEIEVDPDGEDGPQVELDGGVQAGDVEVDLGEASAPPAEEEPDPVPAAPPAENPDGDDGDDEATASDGESSADQDRRGNKVEASGGMANWTPERQARFEAFRAMRHDGFAFGTARWSSVLPGVELAPRRADGADEDEIGQLVYDQPQVAPGVATASPDPDGAQAMLAAAPVRSGPLQEVPVPLQALTGMLIAGTALAWHLTRRELGWAISGLRKRS